MKTLALLAVLLVCSCQTPAPVVAQPCLTDGPWKALRISHLAYGPDMDPDIERQAAQDALRWRRAWMIEAWERCGYQEDSGLFWHVDDVDGGTRLEAAQ